MPEGNNKPKVEVIKNHTCSGGFVFYRDKKTQELFVLLITNIKGELWIPKGHMEAGENQIDTAFREIEEETTLSKSLLKYIGLCTLIKYSFMSGDVKNNKEVYINVFEALEKDELAPRQNDPEIRGIKWYEYEDALKNISFNKDELIQSKKMLEEYLGK